MSQVSVSQPAYSLYTDQDDYREDLKRRNSVFTKLLASQHQERKIGKTTGQVGGRLIVTSPRNIFKKRDDVIAKEIISDIAKKHGVLYSDIVSERRFKRAMPARFEAYWAIKNTFPWSLPRIARLFGKSDHTTIINGVKKHEEKLAATKV